MQRDAHGSQRVPRHMAGPRPGVAYLLPNLIETHAVLWGAQTGGYARAARAWHEGCLALGVVAGDELGHPALGYAIGGGYLALGTTLDPDSSYDELALDTAEVDQPQWVSYVPTHQLPMS
jgi:hypothetical protein